MVASIAVIGQQEQAVNQASGSGTIQRVKQAIQQASARTGVDFSYLLNKASQESNLDPNAKAAGSSATGLFQFTGQTWLQMVKSQGDQYGLGQYADHISIDKNGTAHVSDPNWRKAILSMRKDPTVSAEMAGELDKQNMGALKSDVGGKIGATELYLAHFLGVGGATEFINTMRSDPKASGASVVPDAAAANQSVFYDKSGAPRSLSQIYQHFAQKFSNTPDILTGAGSTMVASSVPAAKSPATFNLADASNLPNPAANYSLPVMGNSKPDTSALFTAMTIAQMDLKNMADATGLNPDPTHKKTQGSLAVDSIV